MTNINVRPKEVCMENDKVMRIIQQVEQVERTMKNLSYRTKDEIAGRYQIGQRIREVQNELLGLVKRIEELYVVTEICMKQYKEMEKNTNKNARAFE